MTRIENEMQYNSAMERIEELLKIVNDDTPEDDKNSVLLLIAGKFLPRKNTVNYFGRLIAQKIRLVKK